MLRRGRFRRLWALSAPAPTLIGMSRPPRQPVNALDSPRRRKMEIRKIGPIRAIGWIVWAKTGGAWTPGTIYTQREDTALYFSWDDRAGRNGCWLDPSHVAIPVADLMGIDPGGSGS